MIVKILFKVIALDEHASCIADIVNHLIKRNGLNYKPRN